MQIISTSIDEYFDAFVFTSDNTSLAINSGVTLVSQIGSGVIMRIGSHVLNAGTILGRRAGIADYQIGAVGGSLVQNDGTIIAQDGIFNLLSENLIVNNGQITATDMGIVSGEFSTISNNGRITASKEGIIASGSSTVNNAGTVFATKVGVWLHGATDLVNSGSVSSSRIGVEVASGGHAVINNTGLLQGGDFSILSRSAGSITIRNSGSLEGRVALGLHEDHLLNTGTINGDVFLGDGNDRFDGRDGSVSGTVNGGAGTDTIWAGDDGETISGGNGRDRLHGGAGADTFVFESFRSTDNDVIRHFDVGEDTIQFDHTVFRSLVADVTPQFTIGPVASTAADHLFYNAATGNLYYDLDGSNTTRSPHLVATLDRGLALTASNFSVV